MKLIIFVSFCLISVISSAQHDEHPIDGRNMECHDIDSNQTTYGMIQCEIVARDEWKVEMNIYYQLLLDTLSEESAALLRKAQAAWIEYEAKESEFSVSMHYSDMDGTMWRVLNADHLKGIVRTRALELKSYYETLTFDGNF